jgi:two-component system invasion response regulator UvrY
MLEILVADDHPIIRKGVKLILSEASDMKVTDEASNGYEVLEKIRKTNFDVILLDLSMPGISGMDVLKQIKKEKPEMIVLVLSRYPEEQYAIPALRAGASGYVPKTSIVDELVNALRKVASGKEYISPSLAEQLAGQIKGSRRELSRVHLSSREHDILIKLASGQRISKIAKDLCLSPTTVSTYRHRIMEKTGFENDADLVRYAIDQDLV